MTATKTGTIRIERAGAVATIVIDNPGRRNALNFAMWCALGEAIDALEADTEIRCLIVRGEGSEAFASGADISEFDAMRADPETAARYNIACEYAMDRLAAVQKPTIAMVQGFCIGGGMALAVGCDIRIVAGNARFAIPAAKLGVGYDYRGIERLAKLVGPSRAKEIFFTARIFNVEEAEAMGLVSRLVSVDHLAAETKAYAELIAANAPLTIAAVKMAVANALAEPHERNLEACKAAEQACFASEDYAEGRRAFAEKRKPVFHGR